MLTDCRVSHFINAPDPGDIGRSDLGKDIVNVFPHRDVIAGGISVVDGCPGTELALGPGIPPAVHFPIKAQEERMSPSFGVVGKLMDITVVDARCDDTAAKIGINAQVVIIAGGVYVFVRGLVERLGGGD